MNIKKINPILRPFVRLFLVASAMIKRFFDILKAGSFDAVYIQKDVLPSFYLFILKMLNKNIIFDLDDALYENHATIKPSIFSLDNLFFKFRKNNLNKILISSKAVTVTVPYLAEYVKRYSKNVHVITGPIDCSLYNLLKKANTENIVIGWIGSPVTSKYVENILPALKKIQSTYPEILFHMIGAKKFETEDLNINFFEWSEEKERKMLTEFDIGIMPLSDDKWSKGKGGLKILQYFAMGIPVVCSPVGINTDLVSDGLNGFWAKSEDDWTKKIGKLITDPALRNKFSIEGRKTVQEKFDLIPAADYIEEIIRKSLSQIEDKRS